jgi:hypothetical protein
MDIVTDKSQINELIRRFDSDSINQLQERYSSQSFYGS